MFQYITIVQTLAQKGQNWLFYDKKFRTLRAKQHIPWERLHIETIFTLLFPTNSNNHPNPVLNCLNSFFGSGIVGSSKEPVNITSTNVARFTNVPIVNVNTRVRPVERQSVTNPTPLLQNRPKTSQLKGLLRVPTPINAGKFDAYLEGYDDKVRKYLISGFSYGLPLGTVGNIPPSIYKYHSSAVSNSSFAETKIKK